MNRFIITTILCFCFDSYGKSCQPLTHETGLEIDLFKPGQSMESFTHRDQGALGTCFAHSALTMIESELENGERYSAIHLAMLYHQHGTKDRFQKLVKSSVQQDGNIDKDYIIDGGFQCESINNLWKHKGKPNVGLCLENENGPDKRIQDFEKNLSAIDDFLDQKSTIPENILNEIKNIGIECSEMEPLSTEMALEIEKIKEGEKHELITAREKKLSELREKIQNIYNQRINPLYEQIFQFENDLKKFANEEQPGILTGKKKKNNYDDTIKNFHESIDSARKELAEVKKNELYPIEQEMEKYQSHSKESRDAKSQYEQVERALDDFFNKYKSSSMANLNFQHLKKSGSLGRLKQILEDSAKNKDPKLVASPSRWEEMEGAIQFAQYLDNRINKKNMEQCLSDGLKSLKSSDFKSATCPNLNAIAEATTDFYFSMYTGGNYTNDTWSDLQNEQKKRIWDFMTQSKKKISELFPLFFPECQSASVGLRIPPKMQCQDKRTSYNREVRRQEVRSVAKKVLVERKKNMSITVCSDSYFDHGGAVDYMTNPAKYKTCQGYHAMNVTGITCDPSGSVKYRVTNSWGEMAFAPGTEYPPWDSYEPYKVEGGLNYYGSHWVTEDQLLNSIDGMGGIY